MLGVIPILLLRLDRFVSWWSWSLFRMHMHPQHTRGHDALVTPPRRRLTQRMSEVSRLGGVEVQVDGAIGVLEEADSHDVTTLIASSTAIHR